MSTAKILLLFLLLGTVESTQSSQYIQGIERGAIVLVRVVNESIQDTAFGSGLLLWNYQFEDSVYLLTADHVLKKYDKIELLQGDSRDGYKPISKSWILLRDSTGDFSYMRYKKKDGNYADIALVSLNRADLELNVGSSAILSRSYCVFSDSLFLGDRILMCGFADKKVFEFVNRGDFMVTSGTLAYKAGESFLVDQKTFPGMSGGIVFKEYPISNKFVFKAAGIVVAGYSRYEDYSWIVKLDYIDSILISNTGYSWGEQKRIQEQD